MVLNASITSLLSIDATINVLQDDNGTDTNMDAVNASIQTLWCRSATIHNMVNETILSRNVSAVNVCLADSSCAQGNNDNFYVGHCLKSCCTVFENAHNSTIYNLGCTDTSKKYMADKNLASNDASLRPSICQCFSLARMLLFVNTSVSNL